MALPSHLQDLPPSNRRAPRQPPYVPSPRVSWDEFVANHFDWRQGQHVTAVGPTGSGKTTLGLHLLQYRNYTVVFSCKPRDTTMNRLLRAGWEKQTRFIPQIANHIVLWPPVDGFAAASKQKVVFRDAMERVLVEGGWCIDLDETAYIADFLGLEKELKMLMQIGRSNDISIINKTQRPAFVPLVIYDQADHLFLWRDNDEVNLKRIGGLGGLDQRSIRHEVASLPKHEFLYVNTRTGEKVRSIAPEVK